MLAIWFFYPVIYVSLQKLIAFRGQIKVEVKEIKATSRCLTMLCFRAACGAGSVDLFTTESCANKHFANKKQESGVRKGSNTRCSLVPRRVRDTAVNGHLRLIHNADHYCFPCEIKLIHHYITL